MRIDVAVPHKLRTCDVILAYTQYRYPQALSLFLSVVRNASNLGACIPYHHHTKDCGRNCYPAFGVQPETTLPIVISYSRSYKFLVHRFAGFEIDASEIPFGFAG